MAEKKYRSLPGLTSEEMLEGRLPPRRAPCQLCVTDPQTSSAWIRYNERRIDELQKRLDFLLRIDDAVELRPARVEEEETATVSQRIDQLLLGQRKLVPSPPTRITREAPRRRRVTPVAFRLLPSTPRLVLPVAPPSHSWRNESDGKTYVLEQFSIPRYYRLYNDVAFREIYEFSRLIDHSKDYSSLLKTFALEHR